MRDVDPFTLKLAHDLIAHIIITDASPVLRRAPETIDRNRRVGGHAAAGDDEFQRAEFGWRLGNSVDTKNLVERSYSQADDARLGGHQLRPVLPKPPLPRSLTENSTTS